ncbi:hypothetical protein P4V86_14320 [Brevibacillus laterosporus]|uniref:hypothetical protein n=1 Tax=Brevibacillus laterosporus TaxID=1465 RepID=UPI000378C78F|nr:hypothetical protein [Brevibacillus laterosporus]ATO49397.1 hypothetical protein BrL25_09895 [Brevibacillus laterosporus DSM 25]MBG9800724.1 hypothetical protein [Brevibacillus laterosporus]MED2004525.1 hypothetical protein [Brevibacillus laterosporus]MED4762292.1 hypothetical protein [Brevibacillus laterosporus]TPH19414.1 hypothetical protein EGH09_06240 [Brevibacillus laterosporus]
MLLFKKYFHLSYLDEEDEVKKEEVSKVKRIKRKKTYGREIGRRHVSRETQRLSVLSAGFKLIMKNTLKHRGAGSTCHRPVRNV